MELKPCPFCGFTTDAPIIEQDELRATFYYLCKYCNASGPVSSSGKEEAVEMWNHRATDPLLN